MSPRNAVFLSFLCSAAVLDASPAASQAIVTRYCVGCHNDSQRTGNVSLSVVKTTAVSESAGTWEKVLRKMRTGEMPPAGLPRPDAKSNGEMVEWLETELDRAAKTKPNPGAPAIHRLNRAEYGNAVRDLLALDLDHSASLPADDSGYGFDNIGEVLTVSPLLMEKYMSTARRVVRLALGTARFSPAIERYSLNKGAAGTSDEMPLGLRGGLFFRRYFPVNAEYSLVTRVRGNPSANLPPPRLDIRIDGERVRLFDVNVNTAEEAQDTRNIEVRVPLQAGMHTVSAAFLDEGLKLEGAGLAPRRFGPPPPTPLTVDYINVAGPFQPTGTGETETRKRIFVCRPGEGAAEEPCARQIFASMARRAYRRPVTDADLAPLMKLFAAGRAEGNSFESGIEMGLRAILVSPGFLFRVERSPQGAAPGSVHRVSERELASRLSFFLWSSIPDEELLALAEQGKLRASLDAQVRRMLADRKARALVENFAGQWLLLRNIPGWRPDPEKYPQFDDGLRSALQRETEMFFQHIIREDRSVLDFISADYTFLNARLAGHYGIDGVRGDFFRRVALHGPERGGILTQGAVLTVTSYPTRTSPVLRGKWILENVLGSPPPPPPPNVPDLAENAAISAKDLRAALEKHRANAGCASCHARLDPLGFALENYDATGRFRAAEGGAPIDASSALPGGTTFSGPAGLKAVLLERRDEFVECLAEKLLTYALGRGLEHYDLPAVRDIRRQSARGEYRFSALAAAIVNSVPFQMRRSPTP